MKYKFIKSVSIKALKDAGACEQELHRFAFLVMQQFVSPIGFNESLCTISVVIKLAEQCKGGVKFLIDKGFIIEETTKYEVNDGSWSIELYKGELNENTCPAGLFSPQQDRNEWHILETGIFPREEEQINDVMLVNIKEPDRYLFINKKFITEIK